MADNMRFEERDGKRILTKYNGNDAHVVIPEGVTQIGSEAFSGCESLQSVVIPQGVTAIGYSTFSGCANLQSVVIPEGVMQIGDGAFWGCSSLQSVVIPQGVTEIEDSAFKYCASLQSVVIPQGVTEIEDSAFQFCDNLQSVEIPDSVTQIGENAFAGCSSLQSVVIPQGVTEIGENAFYWCHSLQSVVIPQGVTEIGENAFYWCHSLQSVEIPDSVTQIGSDAFRDCRSLQSVVIPQGVTEIGSGAFSLDQKITDPFSQKVVLKLPARIKHVGYNFTQECVAEVTLWQGEGTTLGSEHGFSDVYLQIIDTTGLFLCRVYIPYEYVRELEDAGGETTNYSSAYGYWATRLLSGGARNISEYDTFFAGYPDHEERPDQVLYDKARIALCRLRFPYELSEEYKLVYEQFLIQHARLSIQKLAEDNNLEMLTFLLGNVTIPLKKYIDMVDWSAKTKRGEITALLLEYRHRTWGDTVLRLSLDDLAVEADDDELEPD